MALANFLAELETLVADASRAFSEADGAVTLEAARIEFLGAKSGRIKDAQKGLGAVDKADKPAAGKHFNDAKQAIEAAFTSAQERNSAQGSTEPGLAPIDLTLPGRPLRLGRLHPLTQTIEELKEILGRLGFNVADGPEIEDERHNFEALNIPASHPARDPLENFYLATAERGAGGPLLLRSQTSTVQIRVMEATQPPVRIISLGRVYRPDTADDTHYPMFHQIEGLLVDRKVTMADLKSTLRLFAAAYFGGDVHIRFRPSFFPFTEPSVEVDMSWHDRWIEMGGAGMVDPHVLQAVGYDPEEYTGFAFGLGVERVCARRHQVTDIREFYKNDVRFLRQF
ncbi:MAG: phenylalanine--tRNA ligase subunit alpha [Planctomycetia bacterium]|nr:phenylalanine--tRNA ligase subunit alpha [Planctomycetia bacterium]